MNVPSAADIREQSNVAFSEYGYPEPETGTDRLQRKVDESNAELLTLLAGAGYAPVWSELDPLSVEGVMLTTALRMLVEYNVAASQQEIVDTVADFDLLSSYSAGPVSETRRSVTANGGVLHPWPALHKLLSGLASYATGGTFSSAKVPVVGYADETVRPGAHLMDPRRAALSIYGHLFAPGVARAWMGESGV